MQDKKVTDNFADIRKDTGKFVVLSKVWKVFTTLLLILVIVLAVLLAGVRIIGYTPYAVLSGSMTPTYNIGSLVYVKHTDVSLIKENDTITFVAGPDKTVVTHRVIKTDSENGCFYTKGDANESMDASPVYYENVLGRVEFSLPYLGYISIYISTTSGKFTALTGLFVIILVSLIPELLKYYKK